MLRQGDEPVPGYRLQRRLGRGSFGEVWSATGPGRTPAALKFISLSDQNGQREFQAIQRIKKIRHAHLMPIFGIWLVDDEGHLLDDTFLAQWNPKRATSSDGVRGTLHTPLGNERRPVELIEAMPLGDQDLSSRLAACQADGEQGIPAAELLGYLEDAAQAIDFLNTPRHDLGDGPVALYHGDIKPQNIMLVGGVAQLCDFGLARVLGSAQATTTAITGTPAYIAPECIQDKRPQASTDQYSLAITYAELRGGKLPFHAATYVEVINAHLNGNLDLSQLPAAEQEIVRRGAARDPAERYPTTLEMVRDLQRATGLWSGSHVGLPLPAGANAPPSEVRSSHPPRPSSGTDRSVDSHVINTRQLGQDDTAVSGTIVLGGPAVSQSRHLFAGADASGTSGKPRGNRWLLPVSALAALVVAAGSAVWFMRIPQESPPRKPAAEIDQQMADAGDRVASPSDNEKSNSLTPPTPADKNQPPTVAFAGKLPDQLQAGESTSIKVSGKDPEGEQLRIEYRLGPDEPWLVSQDGSLDLKDVQPGNLNLQVRAIDKQGAASTVLEKFWLVPTPNHEPNLELVEAPAQLEVGQSLHVRLGGEDADDEKLKYQWRRPGEAAWQTLAANVLDLKDLKAGHLQLEFRAVDPTGAPSKIVARDWDVMGPNQPPTIDVVTLSDDIVAGDTLRVSLTGTDPDGDPVSFEWRKKGSEEWQTVAGGELEIENLAAGTFALELRGVDDRGATSAQETRTWEIPLAERFVDSAGLTMQLIPAGDFMMGSDETTEDLARNFELPGDWQPHDEQPRHKVRITRPFYLGAYEVTREEFAAFVEATGYRTEAETDGRGGTGWTGEDFAARPEYNWREWGVEQSPRAPVVNVSWNDAQEFCRWLSTKTGAHYRLPTEAEWEYACRAGTNTRFHNGDDPEQLVEVGNVLDATARQKFQVPPGFASRARDKHDFPAEVGKFTPNAFSLHDMHGNSWEWCNDWYSADYYAQSPADDPPGPETGQRRVVRGGSWLDPLVHVRAALRGEEPPANRNNKVGFRVARDP